MQSFPLPPHFLRFQILRNLFLLCTIMVFGTNFMKSNSIGHETKLKGWISMRGGCYASSTEDPYISCTTFNILAPIYKRLDKENQSCRESEYRNYWLNRNQNILDRLLYERSSIICLQEFWVGNEELVDMYEKGLGDVGYMNLKLARTNNRGDGLFTAVHKDYFTVLNYRELLFNDFGDRVAQLLHVESVVPFWQSRNNSTQNQVLIVNTHLLFPHNSSLSIARLQQVYKILKYVESYQREYNLIPMPILLCGDWNGSKRGHVYKFLRSQGFVSSYDTAHQYTDSDADAHKWVSHRNHRGNICGVDFIWLLNPNKSRKPLKTSWCEAVFGIIKYRLHEASLAENDAYAFLKADSHGDYITYSGFCQALHQLSLTGLSYGLSAEEIKDLWIQADIDGNGVVDYVEFQVTCVLTDLTKQILFSVERLKGCLHEETRIGFMPQSVFFKGLYKFCSGITLDGFKGLYNFCSGITLDGNKVCCLQKKSNELKGYDLKIWSETPTNELGLGPWLGMKPKNQLVP